MTLRPKTIDFDASFQLFKKELNGMFVISDQKPVQGMNLYQMTFDMCNAWPDSYAEQLLKGLTDFFDENTLLVRQVKPFYQEYPQAP